MTLSEVKTIDDFKEYVRSLPEEEAAEVLSDFRDIVISEIGERELLASPS